MEPSLQQFVNRLIEFTDEPEQAAAQFAELVRQGMEPNHAFAIVTGR